VPFPAPPSGVDLDLVVLAARQRLQALARGAGWLLLAFCLLPGAGFLLALSLGGLVFGAGSTVTGAMLVAALVVGACGWLAARRGWRLIRRALSVRRTLEATRLAYEQAALRVEARRQASR
jgi:hypothetical protein